MKPPEVIETDRLRLRRPVMEDAAAIFSTYAQDPEVARFVSWSVHPSVDVTRKFVEEDCLAGWKTGQVFPWLITLAAGGDVAGSSTSGRWRRAPRSATSSPDATGVAAS